VVFAANEETEVFLKPYRCGKPLVRLPIASLPIEKIERFRRPSGTGLERPCPTQPPEHPVPETERPDPANERQFRPPPLRLFAGGNIEGRKGVNLALKALAQVKAAGVDFHYTIAGGGPEIKSLKDLAKQLGIDCLVEFHPGYQGDDYVKALQATDVYFLPSFRESTPVTLLEAYLAGCYPVVADTSAQGEIVRLIGGHAVPVERMDSLIQGLADAVIWCDDHRAEIASLSADAASKIAGHFSSKNYDATVADSYALALLKS
jgi:glycosyltransferase involved in cell wall biosynthesis